MQYFGKAIQIMPLAEEGEHAAALTGMLEMRFNREDGSVNKFDRQAIEELHESVALLSQQGEQLRGLLVSSGKDDFIVGADVSLFHSIFAQPEEQIIALNSRVHETLDTLQSLPCPTVAVINGVALGGGLELCLALDFRVVDSRAKLGLPEVKLGIFPGWGGTVRLPRMIGADHALEWICRGEQHAAERCLSVGVADALVAPERLRAGGIDLLRQLSDSAAERPPALDFRQRRQQKRQPLQLRPLESLMAFETAKAQVVAATGPHYPAPLSAVKLLQQQAGMSAGDALAAEAKAFVKMAQHWVCHNLVSVFLGDQFLKKQLSRMTRNASRISRVGVIGAGTMGAGIAAQSVSHGLPVVLRDISDDALDQALGEVSQTLGRRVDRGRMSRREMQQALTRVRATRSYEDLANTELVVEAVSEDTAVKANVLQALEEAISPQTVLTSNTSTLSISMLAKTLQHPARFCGLHFFNPVHRMPLVEVIRGEHTADSTVAQALSYAARLGKTPVVVGDCPGFLVNRILFPYLAGFMGLVSEGVDIRRIDQVMEAFGWPMGPARLLDVVGMDVAAYAQQVMAAAYPDRMVIADEKNVLQQLVKQGRLGQKAGVGFYRYQPDKRGRQQPRVDPELQQLLVADQSAEAVSDQQIVERLMLPLLMEAVRCLDEGIVGTPQEVDMALIYGLGFPPFRGGALRYLDAEGPAVLCDQADALSHLGGLYAVPPSLRDLARGNGRFYAS